MPSLVYGRSNTPATSSLGTYIGSRSASARGLLQEELDLFLDCSVPGRRPPPPDGHGGGRQTFDDERGHGWSSHHHCTTGQRMRVDHPLPGRHNHPRGGAGPRRHGSSTVSLRGYPGGLTEPDRAGARRRGRQASDASRITRRVGPPRRTSCPAPIPPRRPQPGPGGCRRPVGVSRHRRPPPPGRGRGTRPDVPWPACSSPPSRTRRRPRPSCRSSAAGPVRLRLAVPSGRSSGPPRRWRPATAGRSRSFGNHGRAGGPARPDGRRAGLVRRRPGPEPGPAGRPPSALHPQMGRQAGRSVPPAGGAEAAAQGDSAGRPARGSDPRPAARRRPRVPPRRSVRTFAEPHTGRAAVWRVDLKDFFPSVRAGRVHASSDRPATRSPSPVR